MDRLVGATRKIPDLFVIRQDGKVNVREVLSNTDDAAEVKTRPQESMNAIPDEMRGTADVLTVDEAMGMTGGDY